jgi:hypothetical protein
MIVDFYTQIKTGDNVISFIGNITPESIDAIMHNLEGNLKKTQENSKITKKLYLVFLECLQNLYHHSDVVTIEENTTDPSSACVINNNKDRYVITTGNYISNERIGRFKKHLEEINELSEENLKQYYLAILNNGKKSEKDGAGLGMIDILRKSDAKLDFNFAPVNTNYSLFCLNVNILK